MRTFKQKTISWTVYVRKLDKVVFVRGKKEPMKYDEVRTIISASNLQKVFIFLDIFWANNIATKCFLKMMYVS